MLKRKLAVRNEKKNDQRKYALQIKWTGVAGKKEKERK